MLAGLLLILLVGTCLAQPEPATEWLTTWQGAGDARFCSLAPTTDGGSIAVGEAAAAPGEPLDFLIVRLDAEGNLLWQETYGDTLVDRGRAVAAMPDGGFLVAGDTGETAGTRDGLLQRLDGSGNLLWQQQLGWPGEEDRLEALCELPDGGYALAGTLRDRMLLARLDPEGDTLWTRSWDLREGYTDVAHSLTVTGEGGFLLAGQSYHDHHEWIDRYQQLIRTDAAGELIWWNELYDGRYYAVVELAGGDLAVVGEYQAAYLYLARLDAEGEVIWSDLYGDGTYNMLGYALVESPGGNLLVSGREQTGPGLMDALLLCVDGDGEELWRELYDPGGLESSHALLHLPDESYLLAGGSIPSGTAFLLRTGPDATQSSPAVNANHLPGLNQVNLFPNPGNNHITLAFNVTIPGEFLFRLYNLRGQLAADLGNRMLPAGIHERELELSGLPSGVYFLTIESPTGIQAGRATLLQ